MRIRIPKLKVPLCATAPARAKWYGGIMIASEKVTDLLLRTRERRLVLPCICQSSRHGAEVYFMVHFWLHVLMDGVLHAEKRLSKTEPGKGWVDRRGNLKEGTHIILNVGPGFDLRGEGVLPHARRHCCGCRSCFHASCCCLRAAPGKAVACSSWALCPGNWGRACICA